MIGFSTLDITNVLGVPTVLHPEFPFSAHQFLGDIEICRELTGGGHYYGVMLIENHLTSHYHVLDRIVASFFDPINLLTDISINRCQLLCGLVEGTDLIFLAIYGLSLHAS
ncbi:hypothetical protein U1Q18_025934, partial [Sarracenia purpurea var. burkii]